MPNQYFMQVTKKTNDIEEKTSLSFSSGSALYEELYELEPHQSEILDFNEISMFELERTLQKLEHIYLEHATGTALISWFPHETDKFPIADIASRCQSLIGIYTVRITCNT